MATILKIEDGTLMRVKGPHDADLAKLRILCRLNEPDYGVPGFLFANDGNSISDMFPTTLRLEVRLSFQDEETIGENGGKMGAWLADIAKKLLALEFHFPCEVHLALTDSTHTYHGWDEDEQLVALGVEVDFSDAPAMVILENKAKLVQIGVTPGLSQWKETLRSF